MQLLMQFFYRIALVWTGDVDLSLTGRNDDGTSLEDTAALNIYDEGGCDPSDRSEERIFSSVGGRSDVAAYGYAYGSFGGGCAFEAALRVYGDGQLLAEDPASCGFETGCVSGVSFQVDTSQIVFPCPLV